MSNGIASNPALAPSPAVSSRGAMAILLAAMFVSLTGCDRDIARLPAPQAKIDAPQSLPPSVRYRTDPTRNRMWVLTRDGVFLYDASTPKTIVEIALPSWQSVDDPYSCLPDLALGPRGEAVVTSNAVPTLWKIDPDSLAVTMHELALDADLNKDVGFSGLAYSVQYGAFFAVSDMHGSLWRIDPLLRKGEKIPLSASIREASGISVPRRGAQYSGYPRTELCVHAEQGGWLINLAPGGRAANVTAAACTKPLTHLVRGGK
jgi:hypothetical protein